MDKLLKGLSALLIALSLFLTGSYFNVELRKGVEKVLGAIEVRNNPNCATATATSSLSYMTPGTGTSTATCNFGQDAARSAVVAVVLNASSTLTSMEFRAEESMNGVDWFPITMNQIASTTNQFNLTTRGTFYLTFASSTVGGVIEPANGVGVSGVNNRNHYTFAVPAQMKWMRVLAVDPVPPTWGVGLTATTSYNGAVWMQVIPKVEF